MKIKKTDKWFSCQVDGVFGKSTMIFNADDLEIAQRLVYAFITTGVEKVVSPIVETKKSAIKGVPLHRQTGVHSVYRVYP